MGSISLFIFLFSAFTLLQWEIVISELRKGSYKSKKSFLLRMLPGYCIVAAVICIYSSIAFRIRSIKDVVLKFSALE